MSEPLFLIWSAKHSAWWRAERCGYTYDMDQAGHYTAAECDLIEKNSWCSPLPAEHSHRIPLRSLETLG